VNVADKKALLRREMLARRAAMDPAARAGADRGIFERLTAMPEYSGARTIFCYVSTEGEPDTRALIEDALERCKRVCVPRCSSSGAMSAHGITSTEDLRPGRYGIPEPAEHCPQVPPDGIDLVIVPCVCCDREGYRLGYGGGFYDRWLEAHAAAPAPNSHASLTVPAATPAMPDVKVAVALCYEALLAETVPREPHDRRIDIIVTDKALRRVSERRCKDAKIIITYHTFAEK
jgi:5-formyltetrahydrofolate cyclo-ligase